MAEEGFQNKLLRKLSTVEGERLEAEAVRAKIKPRARSTAWSDFRRLASWQFRRDLVVGGWILALLFTGILAAKISVVLLMLWFLALCLVVIYGIGRLMYRIFFAIYFFLTWKKPTEKDQICLFHKPDPSLGMRCEDPSGKTVSKGRDVCHLPISSP